MDKLKIDETNANEWLVEYQGDPERHLLHAVDAIIGFLGKPQQEFSATEISKFLAYLQYMLREENCTIDAPHLAELYKQVQDKCKGEADGYIEDIKAIYNLHFDLTRKYYKRHIERMSEEDCKKLLAEIEELDFSVAFL